jgi:acetyl-CoA C-acetyltransferase
MGFAYIIDGVRTPRASVKKGQSAVSGLHPQELLAGCLRELSKKSKFDKSDINLLLMGCVIQFKEQGANLARNAVLAAEWPESVPASTLTMACGSGLEAVNLGAMAVASEMHHLVVAGGVESMSRVPMFSDGGGLDGNNETLRNKLFQVPQGISADLIATMEKFTREDLDRFAAESHRRAAYAREHGYFNESVRPVSANGSGTIIDADNHIRPDTTAETLNNLKPAFAELGKTVAEARSKTFDELAMEHAPKIKSINHIHTAGNSSGIADGAAALLLASDSYTKSKSLKPRACIRSVAALGEDPILMLTAPSACSQRALKEAKMTVKDIDLWEINEAFAAVPLQVIRRLELDPALVNVNGGAIAMGHPLGATGAMLILTALDELERRDQSTAAITLCVAGGQGVTTIIERC